MRIRTILAAIACGIAVVGGVYGLYALLNAILNASPLTQFLVAGGCASAGSMLTYLSVRDRVG